ncbi:MAG: hypothetical protein NVS3B1_29450 [Marmoricola sp.]
MFEGLVARPVDLEPFCTCRSDAGDTKKSWTLEGDRWVHADCRRVSKAAHDVGV